MDRGGERVIEGEGVLIGRECIDRVCQHRPFGELKSSLA